MFWCFCGEVGLGLLTILGMFVLAENIGTVLKVFGYILLISIIISCLYQLSLNVESDNKTPEKKFTDDDI